MKADRNFMAWNAPGSQGPKRGDSDQDKPNNNPWGNSGSNDRDDPWQRQRERNQRGYGSSQGFDFSALQKWLQQLFKGNKGSWGSGNRQKGKVPSVGKAALGAAVALVLGVYIFSGFYTVREAERGVVLRFGKVYDVVDPGLRWKFTGIDQVNTVDIEQVRSIQSSGSMLTEDENVVLVEMDVQYRVSDPVQYLYSVTDPDNSLTEATDSALRYVVGHTTMDDILTSGREMVRQNTRDLLVSVIEPYKMGLSIVDVNFLPARAPDEVKAAFDDAISAQEDEQRFKREAEAYANEVLPRADGQVQRIRQEAEAYRSRVVMDAQGEVARFEQILPAYKAAPEITRERIYLDTMQEVLGKSQKVIMDTRSGSNGPVLYLPLPGTAPAAAPAPVSAPAAPESRNSAPAAGNAANDQGALPPLPGSNAGNKSAYDQLSNLNAAGSRR